MILLKKLSFFLLILFLLTSCDESYTPRPKGYFRITIPSPEYQLYVDSNCPYSFELPQYSKVDSYKDSLSEPCWKYIRFPDLNAEIFLSYKSLNNDLNVYMEDARALVYKHTVKADAIDETIVEIPGKLYGVIYDIGGNAASSIQFYATDSTSHFIRGALYFNSIPQPDSLAPVISHLRKDIEKMITSIQWK